MTTTLTFIGSAPVIPDVGQDTASFVMNRRHLVDCGWHAALGMRRYDLHPLNLETLFLTHCHHDHVMGLPMLLFYRGMRGAEVKSEPLRIYGPAGEVEEMVELSRQFLRGDRFPEVWPKIDVIPLRPGDTMQAGDLGFRVTDALHPVPALSYRFEDRNTGSVIAYTGDTAYHPEAADLFRNADLLIHEASLSPGRSGHGNRDHSTPEEAAKMARDAGVKRLALIHYPLSNADAVLRAAQEGFEQTVLAEEGLEIRL